MAVLIPPREDRSETWMSTRILSAIGQFKGSGSRFSNSVSLEGAIYLSDHCLGLAVDAGRPGLQDFRWTRLGTLLSGARPAPHLSRSPYLQLICSASKINSKWLMAQMVGVRTKHDGAAASRYESPMLVHSLGTCCLQRYLLREPNAALSAAQS